MVLGMHFSEHPIKLELGEDQRVDEERLYKACQRAMSAANFLGSYGIDKIQIIILLCLWLNNTFVYTPYILTPIDINVFLQR